MTITEKDKKRARACLACPLCKYARRKQKGIIHWFVRAIEGWLCPQCRAYERVTGRKAHEPLSAEGLAQLKKELEGKEN